MTLILLLQLSTVWLTACYWHYYCYYQLLQLLQVCLAEHVRNRGAAAVMDKTRDADLIQLLLEQRRQLDEVITYVRTTFVANVFTVAGHMLLKYIWCCCCRRV
jgi:hypothetical protein